MQLSTLCRALQVTHFRNRPTYFGAQLFSLFSAVVTLSAQHGTPFRPAVPVEPISVIVEAFHSHSIVGLGEGSHGSEQDQAFRLSLIRNPRFVAAVNDIVVETGNSLYQDVMDRFIRGEDVADSGLRQVWENTTIAHTGADNPVYEEFYRAVRNVNAALPKQRQIRVLLGDPPIDWEQVHTFDDVRKWGDNRDPFTADLIRREVLSKNHRALVIYGKIHFERKNERTNFETEDFLAGDLESGGATKLFTIWTTGASEPELNSLQADVDSWPKPSLAILRGTTLGAADFSSFYTSDGRLTIGDGRPRPIPRDQWRKLRMEDQFDAVLYLGASSAIKIVPLSPSRCVDERYMGMRLARMMLVPGGQGQIDRLIRYCETAPR